VPGAGQPASTARIFEITTETTQISSDSIASNQFDIPADWKLYKPEPRKEKEFQCPSAGK
jgi:hypothetical protein